MIESQKFAINYFQAPKNYFWNWADNNEVIEWRRGGTICFRDELVQIIDGLKNYGMPSMGCLLLVLAACQENITKGLDTDNTKFKNILNLLDVIAELPSKFRKGKTKVQLIIEVFKVDNLSIPSEKIRSLKDELSSGRIDKFIEKEGKEIRITQINNDIKELEKVLQRFQNKDNLELLMKTGVEKIPEKVSVDFQEKQSGLLEQLEEDNKTNGISNLTRRLIAAIDLPVHSSGSSNQPFGGISDITNRGNFDRLLPSELAQDDLVLTARLINNEAMYFRREEPPATPLRNRVILIDTTMKMWGTSRIFAISAALACNENNKSNVAIQNFSLTKDSFNQENLTNKDGIINLMEQLNLGLDCYEAVKSFSEIFKNNTTDYILIISSDTFHDISFKKLISEINGFFSFLITVNRYGELFFYELIGERTKIISKAKFDLDELLFNTKNSNKFIVKPAFLNYKICPLYFPTPGIKLSENNTFYLKDPDIPSSFELILITEQKNVLYWTRRDKGAIELIDFIEDGSYYLGYEFYENVYLIVNNPLKNIFKLYSVSLTEFTFKTKDFSEYIHNFQEAVYKDHLFYIKTTTEIILIDCDNQRVIKRNNSIINLDLFEEYKNKSYISYNSARNYIYNGYNILKRVKYIYINENSQLAFDKYSLSLRNNSLLLIQKLNSASEIYKEPEISYLINNSNIKFYISTWQDGSQAIIDSRGFLHLKSSDESLPEISIVMIVGKNHSLTCWASNGVVCGSQYFYPNDKYKVISSEEFYNNYIQQFIDKLIY